MSQFNAPQARRRGGDLDVYTGLALVATIVLTIGVIIVAMSNMEHSKDDPGKGSGPIKLIN